MLKWSDSMKTGFREIDRQHEELFKRANALFESMRDGKSRDTVAPTLAFLKAYVIEHFQCEESLMNAHIYPLRREHKHEHEKLVEQFLEICKQVEDPVTFSVGAIALQRTLSQWLVQHISSEDKRLGAYLNEKLAA